LADNAYRMKSWCGESFAIAYPLPSGFFIAFTTAELNHKTKSLRETSVRHRFTVAETYGPSYFVLVNNTAAVLREQVLDPQS
jgi:hypothetical protein